MERKVPMIEFNEPRGRGIQEVDVFTAADALLAEGKRPTIERVRLKIGRGSPNTVSPMLERWFATLGERVVGVKPAGNDSDGMPTSVRNAARLLGETARREAEEVQRVALESAQGDLQAREGVLAAAQAACWTKYCLMVVVHRNRVRRNPAVTRLPDIRRAACGTTITTLATICSDLLRSHLRFGGLDCVRVVRLIAITNVITGLLKLDEFGAHLGAASDLSEQPIDEPHQPRW